MNQHLTDEQITAWLAASPDASTREHLQHCAECTQEAEQLQSLVARLGETMRREAAATEPRRCGMLSKPNLLTEATCESQLSGPAIREV
jgi:hypothetical protein